MSADGVNQACKNYFNPTDMWRNGGNTGKLKAAGACLSYLTLVTPIFMKILEYSTDKKLKGRVSSQTHAPLEHKTHEVSQIIRPNSIERKSVRGDPPQLEEVSGRSEGISSNLAVQPSEKKKLSNSEQDLLRPEQNYGNYIRNISILKSLIKGDEYNDRFHLKFDEMTQFPRIIDIQTSILEERKQSKKVFEVGDDGITFKQFKDHLDRLPLEPRDRAITPELYERFDLFYNRFLADSVWDGGKIVKYNDKKFTV